MRFTRQFRDEEIDDDLAALIDRNGELFQRIDARTRCVDQLLNLFERFRFDDWLKR